MSQFPNQKLTYKEKIKEYGSIEEWARMIFDSISQIANLSNRSSNYTSWDKELLIDLGNGVLNREDFEYVIKPYGEYSPKYPAEFRHYDRISSKLHLLIGEEIKRPFNFKAVSINPNSVTIAEQAKKEMIINSLQQELVNELVSMGLIDPKNMQENMSIPQIEEYMRTSYQDIHEIQANMALDFLKEFCNLEEVFNKGFSYSLKTGDDIYYTGTSYNEPLVRAIDPRYFEFDRSPYIDYIEDAQWAYEERWIPASRVYEEFGEFLEEKDVEAIEKMKGSFSQNVGYGSGIPTVYLREKDNFQERESSFLEMSSNSIVRVTNFCWKGLRKLGFVSYRAEDGSIQERVVGEEYKKQPEDLDIKWEWVNEVWEAILIGEDLIVGVQPRPNQYKSLDNPQTCKLPYTGVSDINLSLVKKLKELQYLYDVIMYRKEIAVARAKGKLLVMDTAQIPVSEGIDLPKWINYAEASGFAFINSFEEGKGIFGGQRPNFNQFTEIDLTISNTIQQYILILDKIDLLIEDISGVTRQRQGQISQYETRGGVERSVVQSSAVTEYLFYRHNKVKRRVITNLLEESKLCWVNGKKTQYVMDDMTRKIINIDGDIFNNSEYAVFISDSTKDAAVKQTIEQLAQAALQNQQSKFSDIIALLETNSLAKAKSIIKTSEEKVSQEQQAMAEQEISKAREIEQLRIQAEKDKLEDEQAHEIELEHIKGYYDLKAKEIDSFKFQRDQDVNDNNVPDQLEIAKLKQQEAKDLRDHKIREKELQIKQQEVEVKKKQVKQKSNQNK